MTDLTLPPSARRFASFLDREYCVWMPSASVALLAALVTGRGRPKRLLVQENAPAFVSNIGLVTGAAIVKVRPPDIDEVLEDLLRAEGLSPDHVWGVATHRNGELAPTDWLSRCAAAGVPTVELCIGSLFALARWGPSPTMFTIVDLDAEEVFAGARLTALLTGDRTMATRVQRLCLPGPEAQDYVLDAWPRGLAHDEPALVSLVERATGLGGGKSEATSNAPALTLPSTRPFPSVGGDSFDGRRSSEAPPAPVEDDRLRSELAEAEARHAEALLAAAANASSLQSELDEQRSVAEEWERHFQAAETEAASRAERDSVLLSENQKKLDERQRIIDQWEDRFREAESEAALDAAILSSARAELLKQKNESGRALPSTPAESAVLAQKLMRAERERDLAVADAARRDESERQIRSEFQQRVEQFKKAAAASGHREARQAKAAEASRALLSAQVARLEADVAAFGQARADLLKQKTKAEQALALVQTEKQALARKLKDLDAELSETLADGAKSAAAHRAALDEKRQRAAQLERDVAALTAREAAQVRGPQASPPGLSGRIAALEAEKEALVQRLSAAESGRDAALSEAARREDTQRSAMAEQRARAERLDAEAEAHKAREAHLTEEWARARAGLAEQISRLEAEVVLTQKTSAGLSAEKAEGERALAQARAEAKGASEKLAEAERGHTQVLADALGAQEALRVSLGERIARLEADSALAEKARGELQSQKEESERARALLQSEQDTLSQRLAGVESERDRALTQAQKHGEALRAALEERRQHADRSEKDPAVQGASEATRAQAQAWESQRLEMAERIARLEASAVEVENAHRDQFRRMAANAERAVAVMREEGEAVARKLTEVEVARDLARAEMARREETHRAALEGQGQRADQLEKEVAALEKQGQRADQFEKEVAARAEREARLADEWALLRAEMSERIVRTEAAAVAAENARAELIAEKTEGDRTFASIRAENEGLVTRLAVMEKDHSTALAEAVMREDAQRLATDAERQRAEQLEEDAAAFVEREAKLSREWETSRTEWSERIRLLEDAAAMAGSAHADLLAHKNEAEQALASLQTERETLVTRLAEIERDRDRAQAEVARHEETHRADLEKPGPLAQQLENEAAVAERESTQAEAWEAARTELVARIARLEASEVIADKARTELLNRKRDSDRALAAAQAERAALLKKLATAEHARDQAQAAVARYEGGQGKRVAGGASLEGGQSVSKRAAPGDSPDAAGKRDTGGLSALVSLWNTSVIRRPSRIIVPEEKPPDPPVDEVLSRDVIPDQAPTSSDTTVISGEDGQGTLDRPVQASVAPVEAGHAERPGGRTSPEDGQAQSKPAAPGDSRAPASVRNTGGLSALVNLWNTAATMRPFRRKEPEQKPPDPPADPVFGIEVMPDQAPPSSGLAPIHAREGQRKLKPPAQAGRARPTPPRRSEPKPAPVPDDTKELGGWLRGLAKRMRGKP